MYACDMWVCCMFWSTCTWLVVYLYVVHVCMYVYMYRYKCVKDCYLFNKRLCCWCFYHSLYCKYFLLKPLYHHLLVCLCVRTCMCMCVRERERERERWVGRKGLGRGGRESTCVYEVLICSLSLSLPLFLSV